MLCREPPWSQRLAGMPRRPCAACMRRQQAMLTLYYVLAVAAAARRLGECKTDGSWWSCMHNMLLVSDTRMRAH